MKKIFVQRVYIKKDVAERVARGNVRDMYGTQKPQGKQEKQQGKRGKLRNIKQDF